MKKVKILCAEMLILTGMMMTQVHAEGNVAGVLEATWKAAREQVMAVVNNVIFPICDMVLVIAFFIKLGMSYFDYRKQGMFDWTAPAILFVCLCFTLTAPSYIWGII